MLPVTGGMRTAYDSITMYRLCRAVLFCTATLHAMPFCFADPLPNRLPPVARDGIATISDPAQREQTVAESLLEEADAWQNSPLYPLPAPADWSEIWDWHLLPNRLIYRPYLAGVYQPRMAAVFNVNRESQWKWDLSIGGRVGLVRYGSGNEVIPQGWQLDIEGAAFPRLASPGQILEATDYRFGIPLSYGYGAYQMQIAYEHISSHLGDEWAKKHGIIDNRINYSRDAIVWGHGYVPDDRWRFYGQVGYGFYADVAEPWHFEFGIEYSDLAPTGIEGVPFFATNCQLRQENNFGGYVAIQTGWQWTGAESGRRLRLGVQYFNGQHEKLQFYELSEQKVGAGLWYDF